MFEKYISEWSRYLTAPAGKVRRPDGLPFSTQIFKNKIQFEIGNEHLAVTAFNLFHSYFFTAFVDHCIDNLNKMSVNNGDKFRDLLITSAPVINLVKDSEPYIKKIVDIAGGAVNVYKYVPTYPQFCYEMLFCAMVDTDDTTPEGTDDGVISQACEYTCSEIDLTCLFADEERTLLRIVGYREAEEGSECLDHFKLKWCPDTDDVKILQ
jgi:hypothetical protein